MCLLCVLRSMASSLYNPHTLQYFSTISLQLFFGRLLGLAPSTSYSIHFLHPIIIFFSQHMPIPSQPVCCSTEIMSYNTSLSLNSLLGTLFCSYTPHTHILPFSPLALKCHLIFLSYRPGLTSMKHITSHTRALQCPSHCQ